MVLLVGVHFVFDPLQLRLDLLHFLLLHRLPLRLNAPSFLFEEDLPLLQLLVAFLLQLLVLLQLRVHVLGLLQHILLSFPFSFSLNLLLLQLGCLDPLLFLRLDLFFLLDRLLLFFSNLLEFFSVLELHGALGQIQIHGLLGLEDSLLLVGEQLGD